MTPRLSLSERGGRREGKEERGGRRSPEENTHLSTERRDITMRSKNAPAIYKIKYISQKGTSGVVHQGTMLRTELGELRRSGVRVGGGGRAQEAKKGQEGGKRCRRGCGASKHTHAAEGWVWTRRGGAGHRTPDHTCQQSTRPALTPSGATQGGPQFTMIVHKGSVSVASSDGMEGGSRDFLTPFLSTPSLLLFEATVTARSKQRSY